MEARNTIIDGSGQQLLNKTKIDSYGEIFVYSFQDFINWWYIRMALWHFRRLARLSVVVDDFLSISILIRHFFLPWHRDYSLIGYFFGIVVKLLYLPIAISLYLIAILVQLAIILLWFALPIGTLVFIFMSIFT